MTHAWRQVNCLYVILMCHDLLIGPVCVHADKLTTKNNCITFIGYQLPKMQMEHAHDGTEFLTQWEQGHLQ